MSHRRRMELLALGAGSTVALCWLPFGLAPLVPLTFLMAMRGLRHARTSSEAVRFGVIYGAVRYAVAGHFFLALLDYSAAAILLYLMIIVFILPFSVLEAWGAFQLERRAGLPRSVGLMLLWPLLEKVRTLGDLSFPADAISNGFGAYPAWLAWNSWLGPFGMSLLALGVAALLDLALEQRWRGAGRRAVIWPAVLAVALWLAPPASDLLQRPGARPGPELRVRIVQPNVSIREKLDRRQWPRLWRRLETFTLAAANDADLVVWPETARPGHLIWHGGDEPPADPEVQALADRAGVPILYGAEVARVRDGRVAALYNAAVLVRPGGERGDWYGKQRLLPFVEGIPFARLIGWDPAQRERPRGNRSYLSLMGNFASGPRPTIFEIGAARIGVLICYEGMYPQLGRRYRADGANALVVLTNDAWWGRSVFPRWHAQMVGSLARSVDVPVIRAANSGVSSATDRFGRMTASTELLTVTTLQTTLTPATTPAPAHVRYGHLVVIGIVVFLGSFVGVRRSWALVARLPLPGWVGTSSTRVHPQR